MISPSLEKEWKKGGQHKKKRKRRNTEIMIQRYRMCMRFKKWGKIDHDLGTWSQRDQYSIYGRFCGEQGKSGQKFLLFKYEALSNIPSVACMVLEICSLGSLQTAEVSVISGALQWGVYRHHHLYMWHPGNIKTKYATTQHNTTTSNTWSSP